MPSAHGSSAVRPIPIIAIGRAALRGEDAASLAFNAPALDGHLRAEFYA